MVFWSFSYRRLIGPVVDGFLVWYIRCLDRWQMVSLSGLYGQLDSDKRDNLELSGPVVDGFLVRYVRAFDSGWNGKSSVVQSSGGWFLGQVCGVILW